MFKTKEELIQDIEIYMDKPDTATCVIFYNDGVKEAFESFAERVEFYKKYHNHRDKFNKDYPDKWNIKIEFNWWLFDYCFGGIE